MPTPSKPKAKPSNPPNRRPRRGRRTRKRQANSSGVSSQRPVNQPGQASVAAAYASGQRTRAPKIVATRDQVRITHRELLSSVAGTTNFTVPTQIPLNPGLPYAFPWLSTQAQAWERYRFNSLKFEYFTRTGSNVPGSVMLVPDYDASDAAPDTEQIASSYEDVAEDAPWKDICCSLRPSALHAIGPTKFIRSGPIPANTDIKTYDAGNFFLCTVDGTAVNWGKLWVEYDVTLFTPQLPPSGGGLISAAHLTGANPNSGQILGANPTYAAGSSRVITGLNNTITFDVAGKYLVVLMQHGTAVTLTSPTLSAGASYQTILSTNNAGEFGSGDDYACIVAVVNALNGTVMTFANTISAGDLSDLFVSQLPGVLQ